jgi:hypothetical protein
VLSFQAAGGNTLTGNRSRGTSGVLTLLSFLPGFMLRFVQIGLSLVKLQVNLYAAVSTRTYTMTTMDNMELENNNAQISDLFIGSDRLQ